ncbi:MULTISPECIES: thioredoxin domain-containing protein [unclassified Microbacterium]|uniref:thioredoxin domain-containing protein n=1 Tax=unclassified Microbacterium TaxID=2609290 RepID=UPI000C2C0570|nr:MULTISPECIES: DUF255 domain-containing protein [unclassified Microbacterium]
MASRLAEARSPYLRAHAGNPVAWYPWGPEAFAEAARRDVPVLVSIGYSTCHWCHVMARESFSDAAIAAQLNEGFVAIKVDREEHPDVDATYLAAAAAFTPHLGWPLTVFATPTGVPFYAGTYYPPEARPPVPAFRDVLNAVREAWTDRRDEVDGTAAAIAEALRAVPDGGDGSLPTLEDLAAAVESVAAAEDAEFGGFISGGSADAPKFPIATVLRFLQAPGLADKDPAAAALAARTVRTMAASPLRDPVEGGFFRYATRRDWSVPHYERMLTDNAQLLDAAVRAGDEPVAAGIASFLIEVLQQASGGFGAAQDSESVIGGRRSEGGYYAQDAAGRAVLSPPAVDGKVVTGWNGLAIGALARAGARLGRPAWIEAAARAAEDVLQNNLRPDGTLVRASLDEIPSRAPAVLADYGQLASGLVALSIAAAEPAFAVAARTLVDLCVESGVDSGDGPATGTLRAPGGGDTVLGAQGFAAAAGESDGDEPSGHAAIAGACLDLWLLGAGEEYRARASVVVASRAAEALARPLGYGALLAVAVGLAAAPRQVVVVADDADDPLARAARVANADIVAVVPPHRAAQFAGAGFSLFEAKTLSGGRATAYDCRAFVCRLPTTDPEDLADAPRLG